MHGWIHEIATKIDDRAEEKRLLTQAIDALIKGDRQSARSAIARRNGRSAGIRSACSLRQAFFMNFEPDGDGRALRADRQTARLPVWSSFPSIGFSMMRPISSGPDRFLAESIFKTYQDEFDLAYEEGTYFMLTLASACDRSSLADRPSGQVHRRHQGATGCVVRHRRGDRRLREDGQAPRSGLAPGAQAIADSGNSKQRSALLLAMPAASISTRAWRCLWRKVAAAGESLADLVLLQAARLKRLALGRTTFIAVTGSCGKTTTTQAHSRCARQDRRLQRRRRETIPRRPPSGPCLKLPAGARFCLQEVGADQEGNHRTAGEDSAA